MVLGLIGFRNRDQWEPGKQFRAEDRCQIGRSWIIAKEDHVASESFAEDADKWYYLVDCRGLDDLDQKLAHLDQDIADSEQAIEESRRATVASREQTEASTHTACCFGASAARTAVCSRRRASPRTSRSGWIA